MKITKLTVFLLLLTGCAVSPTGKKQLLIFSGEQMSQMGVTAFNSMKTEQDLDESQKANQYVQCITDRLLMYIPSNLAQREWEVRVFIDDTPNAFALPGAKIGIHTGMLKIANTPGKLAAVIGHEIGHVWARHGNQRMSQQTVAQMGIQVVSVLAGEPSAEKQLALGALGIAGQGAILKFSRDHESEADALGLEMMAKAGFDPKEAVALWKKMAEQSEGKNVPEFFSTHPSEQTRINDLTRLLPRAQPFYDQAARSHQLATCRL